MERNLENSIVPKVLRPVRVPRANSYRQRGALGGASHQELAFDANDHGKQGCTGKTMIIGTTGAVRRAIIG